MIRENKDVGRHRTRFVKLSMASLVLFQLAACGSSSSDADITINQPPTAFDLAVTTDEDSPLDLTLRGEDGDGAIVEYAVTGPPDNGSLTGVPPDLTYTPAAGYSGSDNFVYRVTDDDGATATATVTITVNPVNDAPTARDDSFTAARNEVTTIDPPGVLANDFDVDTPSANLTVTAETIATREGGSVRMDADGGFTYTPPTAVGVTEDSFDYTLNDNDPIDPQTGTGTVTITLIARPDGLSVQGLPATPGDTAEARIQLSDADGLSLDYLWSVDGDWVINSGQGTDAITLTAPVAAGAGTVGVVVVSDDSGNRASANLPLSTAGDLSPVLGALFVELLPSSGPFGLAVDATDPEGLGLDFTWTSDGAVVASSAAAAWRPPSPGRYRVDIEVNNGSRTANGWLERVYTGGASWPFFRGTRQGTGARNPADTSSNLGRIRWERAFTTAACSTSDNFVPGVVQGDDGTLYAGSSSEARLYAFNPDSGVVEWSFSMVGTRVNGTPVVALDGTIYVAEDGGTVYAVNADGTERWSYATGAPVSGSPAIGGDRTVYVGTDNSGSSVVYALNPEDGSQKWAAPFALAAETRSSVNFAADGTVYARDYAGNLFAIDPDDGSQRWQINLGGGSGSTPAIGADGTLYFGAFSPPRLHAVWPDGTAKWDTNLDDPQLAGIGATPSIGNDGTVYVGVWERGLAGSLYAVDPVDGSVIWRRPLDSYVQSASSAVGADGTVYVASQRGILYALESDTGAVRWSYDIGAAVNEESPSPLSIGADGSLYVYTCDGVLRAFF